MNRVIADYHMHTRFSPDSKAEPADMCRAAIAAGLKEIAVTDHYEMFPAGKFSDSGYCAETMLAQQAALDECREQFAGQLTIRHGIEIGQPQCDRSHTEHLMKTVQFDFVIGSVHKMDGLDLGLVTYTDENTPLLIDENLSMLEELAKNEDFDSMGHVNIINRYSSRQGRPIDLMNYADRLEVIFRHVIERGKGIEINTSGLRQAAKETLPNLPILKFYHDLGGEILTIGSDAHRPEDVAADLETAGELARTAGFRFLALYEARKPHFYRIAD